MKLELTGKEVELIQQALKQMFNNYMNSDWEQYTSTCDKCLEISTLNFKITRQILKEGV